MLEIQLLNRIGDAIYYSGDIAGSLAPYRQADALVDARIAEDGAVPQWLILRGENAFNISGTLGEMPGRSEEAFSAAKRGEVALKQLLDFGPDAAAEKKLLVLYGQEALLLEQQGRIKEALVPSRASVALRQSRLQNASGDPQRMRDLAIGLAPNAALLGRAGLKGQACSAAEQAVATWQSIEAQGRLRALVARKNVPKAKALAAQLCG